MTPWKYGFKSIKSIVNIEFTREQSATFWNTLVLKEYGFTGNVELQVPHPRWSQASERMIGNDEVLPTLPYTATAISWRTCIRRAGDSVYSQISFLS